MKVLSEQELKAKLAEKLAEKFPKDSDSNQAHLKQEVEGDSPKGPRANPENDQEKAIKKYLLSTLARREYSAYELKTKLIQKEFDVSLSETVLQKFIDEGLQSDQRFCEMFIRSRITKSSGPFKIRMELNAKGVAASLIDLILAEADCDWFEVALEAAQKKAFSLKTLDFKEKGRLMRFLQGKGFDQEHIRYALDHLGLRRSSASE